MATHQRYLLPFWKETTGAHSNKLWSPVFQNFDDLNPNDWTGWKTSIVSPGWCSTKFWKSSHPHNDGIEWQDMFHFQKPNPSLSTFKSRKVLLQLTTPQKDVFNKWLDATRFVYNCALAAVKHGEVGYVMNDLRALFVKNNCPLVTKHPWLKLIPYEVRDSAIIDLCNNFFTNLAKFKATGQWFKLHFQTKRSGFASMRFRKRAWNPKKFTYQKTFMAKVIGKKEQKRIESFECMPHIGNDGRIVKENGSFYFVVNEELKGPKLHSENQRMGLATTLNGEGFRKRKVVAIDPGIRTFLTCYDPSGAVVEVGAQDIERLNVIQDRIDTLVEKAKTMNHRGRYKVRRYVNRIRKHLKDKVNDTHYRVSKWLARNYEYILLPKMHVRQMVRRRKGRRINGTTVKNLFLWRHPKFYERLQQQCERVGSTLIACSEEYTSKTCGKCGELNENLGSQKVFKCDNANCDFHIDRDFNGARNILLKGLTECLL